jgi:hypothetical protein
MKAKLLKFHLLMDIRLFVVANHVVRSLRTCIIKEKMSWGTTSWYLILEHGALPRGVMQDRGAVQYNHDTVR